MPSASNNIIYKGATCTITEIPGTGNVVKKRLAPAPMRAQDGIKTSHQFAVEARILTELKDHPHVVPIEESKVPGEIILKKATHGNLKNFLADYQAQLSPEARHEWCQQVVSTIVYLHDLGIVHGELTAENILVNQEPDGEYTLWICDFGRSSWLNQRVIAELPVFPNDSKDIPESATVRADLYNLGVIIHIITTNRWPHHVPTNEKDLLEDMHSRRYDGEIQSLYPLDEFKLDETEFTTIPDLSARRAMVRCMARSNYTSNYTGMDIMRELLNLPGRL